MLFLLTIPLFIIFNSFQSLADEDKILATIKPLHSLVSSVVGETDEVGLLLSGEISPHNFQLKPSQVLKIQDAKVIFYISDNLESPILKMLKNTSDEVKKIEVINESNLTLLPIRVGGVWEKHMHDEHDQDQIDVHIWLDPNNAINIVKTIENVLSNSFPENSKIYKLNADEAIKNIINVKNKIENQLNLISDKSYLVFHNAFQYFEKAYDLNGVGSIVFEPDEFPSANRLISIREKLKNSNPSCVFREPQFSDKLIKIVIEGSNTKIGILDPLGLEIEMGEELYPKLLNNISKNLLECLS